MTFKCRTTTTGTYWLKLSDFGDKLSALLGIDVMVSTIFLEPIPDARKVIPHLVNI